MDKKIYERTRYQNIYRHKKNKNYIVMMSKPIKTSISKVDNKKIFSIEQALKIRENNIIKNNKANTIFHKESFDMLWEKYIFDCIHIRKLSYETYHKKEKMYNKYFKEQFNVSLNKLNREYFANYIDNSDCSIKQKNEILVQLTTFFNWCIEEKYLNHNPISGLKKYKVSKCKMKYWLPNEFKTFIDILNVDIETDDLAIKKKAYMIKILTLIGFNLGNRIGETRALTFGCIDREKETISILHSINYNPNSDDPLGHTKNYQSQRIVDVTSKLINEIENYKNFLMNELNLEINDDTIIFFNHKTNKPYSDVALRKQFYYYCDKANVPKIRMYDLRHTYVATMMSENKELYQISERIGHSNFNTTINKYGHLSNKTRKEIAKTTDKYY